MEYKKFHFHSIIVHAVVAFVFVSAITHIFEVKKVYFMGIYGSDWRFMTVFMLFFVFILTIPATLSGISEINKMYVNWHFAHKAKLVLSVILFFSTGYILFDALTCEPSFCAKCGVGFGVHSFFVIVVNNFCVWLLSYYGLRISLGRQSFEKTSYVPDFFNKEKPVDILDVVREEIKEKPKIKGLVDLGEGLE